MWKYVYIVYTFVFIEQQSDQSQMIEGLIFHSRQGTVG